VSVDRYSREYHLTARGWELGIFHYYSHPMERGRIPRGCVLTLVKDVEQSFALDPSEITWRELWKRPNADAEIRKLKRKFGSFP
jgi:hypothetical protein